MSKHEATIRRLAERFCGWKLPEDFCPDAGVTFDPVFNKGTRYEMRHQPTGTNLLSVKQAMGMLAYVLEDEPAFSEFEQLEKAFDMQSDELLVAVKLLKELGEEHLAEFRRRAYPDRILTPDEE